MITRLQAPARIGSRWRVCDLTDTLRNLVAGYDAQSLQVHEIRSFVNLCVSTIAEVGGSTANFGYYGVHCVGEISGYSPTPYIDLNYPNTIYTTPPLQKEVGGIAYSPDQPDNPYTLPAAGGEVQTDTFPLEGIFGTVEEFNGEIDPNFYREYFIPSAVLDDVVNVALNITSIPQTRGPLGFSLTKSSIDELMFHSRRDSALSQHGYWTYYGGRVYVYVGKEIMESYTGIEDGWAEAMSNFDFDLFCIRKPVLDNMLPVDNPKSGYWKHVDLPDKSMRLLIIMVQKMILEKLGKPVSMELEQIIAQGLGQLAGTDSQRYGQMAERRMRTEQGFQSR